MKKRIDYSARLVVVEDEQTISIPYELSISATSTSPALQRELQKFLICATKQQERLIAIATIEGERAC